MKKLIAILGAALVIGAAAFAYNPIQNIYLDGSTNTVNVAGSNVIVSRVEAATTNTFNLNQASRSQNQSTNLWPSQTFGDRGLNDRQLSFTVSLTASAADTTAVVFRFAGSADGYHWNTNFTSFNVSPAGTATVTTNLTVDSVAYPFIALYQIENSHATAAISNIVLTAATKPGI